MRILPFLLLIGSASLSSAQTINEQAVDTLTKDVAAAVFKNLQLQPENAKAVQIYTALTVCGNGCDALSIIKRIGGYEPVEAKMRELSALKNDTRFIAMSPARANVAIRNELTLFYDHYKQDNNYSKSLSPAVQERILAKIDQLLPPDIVSEQPETTIGSPSQEGMDDTTRINASALRQSQLERQEKGQNIWMMIVSGLIGLVVGAGAVYLFLYRRTQAEATQLRKENNQLRNTLETAQRTKGSQEVNAIRTDYRQKANAYDLILAELGTDNPLTTIRQLKQQAMGTSPKSSPGIRSAEPPVASSPAPEPIQPPEQAPPVQQPEPVVTAPRSEVFYFPPPDPTGQFDLAQKSGTLSPESAYRFSVGADNPSVASFRFEADPGRLARFLTYRNYMIEPACDSENTYTSTHTRVAMRRDGEAMLDNGTWRVKTKALIRYE